MRGPRYVSPANARCWNLVFTLEGEIQHTQTVEEYKSTTNTSNGYIIAQLLTPAKLPHAKGTKLAWIGAQLGVGPCSPDGNLPSRCRITSYSAKYNAVPAVSRTAARHRSLVSQNVLEDTGILNGTHTYVAATRCRGPSGLVFERYPLRTPRYSVV